MDSDVEKRFSEVERRLDILENSVSEIRLFHVELARDIDQIRYDVLRIGSYTGRILSNIEKLAKAVALGSEDIDWLTFIQGLEPECIDAQDDVGRGGVISWTDGVCKAAATRAVMYGIVSVGGTVIEARKGRRLAGNIGEPRWFVGRNIAEFSQPDQIPIAMAKLAEIVEKKKSGRFDLTIHVDGQSGLRKVRGWPMDDGNVFFITELPEKR